MRDRYNDDFESLKFPKTGDLHLTVGLAAKVRSEVHALNEERREIEDLRLVTENLPSHTVFDLSFEELRYFGF